MPFAIALIASAVIHVAALISPGWDLPSISQEEPREYINAVLKPAEPSISATAQATAPSAEGQSMQNTSPKPPRKKTPSHRTRHRAPVKTPDATAMLLPSDSPSAEISVEKSAEISAETSVETSAETPNPENTSTDVEDSAASPAPTFSKTTDQLASTAPPLTFNLPPQGRIRFNVTRGERGFIVGQSINTWQHDGIHYHFKAVTETTGLAALFKTAQAIQESQGDITPTGLQPNNFSSQRKGKKEIATLDWTNHQITFAEQTVPVTDGTQDMLSLYYQLSLMVASNQSMDAIELMIATGRKLERYRFELIGTDNLAVLGAEHQAQHLRTKTRNDTIDLWIAKTVPGLPLKIRFMDSKGEVFEQVIDEIFVSQAPIPLDPAKLAAPDMTPSPN